LIAVLYFSFAVAVTACYALPILIPQDDAVGSRLIVAIIYIFLLSLLLLVARRAVPMVIAQDDAAAFTAG